MKRLRYLALPVLLAPAVASAAFDACRADLERKVRDAGIDSKAALEAVAAVEQRERILELDRSQPEFVQTFQAYLERRVTDDRVERGRELLGEHRELLGRVHNDFGIPPAYLIAFWGMETAFGDHFGEIPVLDSLATLACDERRSAFFQDQFLEAVRIIDDGNMDAAGMEGSWAGAMGHMQFLPSTYNDHAVDYDDSGRIDIWDSLPDAFGSAGRFLANSGWQAGERWGREVRLPDDFDYRQARLDNDKPLAEWAAIGVRTASGAPLPEADMSGSIILPSGHEGPAFLVYDNFHVILRWNRSISYALAVGHLADRIRGMGQLQTEWEEAPLSRDAVVRMQERLQELGHEPGKADGVPGPGTRAALRAFQTQQDLPADGHPDPETREALERATADE
ncbi:MAG: lytic murein transglycosylase [Ectothiorhodospiraceae bacterium]